MTAKNNAGGLVSVADLLPKVLPTPFDSVTPAVKICPSTSLEVVDRVASAEKIVLLRSAQNEKSKPAVRPDIGYLARPFCRCHFPMTNPGPLREYVRRDGDRVLTLVATSKYGLPYGTDLVVLYGLCTRGRELYRLYRQDWNGEVSFSSTAEMLRYFGDPPTQYYYDRRMLSLLRILYTEVQSVKITARMANAERLKLETGKFLESIIAWFQLDSRQIGLRFENLITFTPGMREWIRTAPEFEDDKVFRLKQSVGALQLYLLLRDRCAQIDLREKSHGWIPIHGPNSLESQLGWVKTPTPEKVRWQLEQWLQSIRAAVWPDCPGEIHQGRDGNWRLIIAYAQAA